MYKHYENVISVQASVSKVILLPSIQVQSPLSLLPRSKSPRKAGAWEVPQRAMGCLEFRSGAFQLVMGGPPNGWFISWKIPSFEMDDN